jgi:Protein of unknown function (DUF3800)
LNNSHNNENVLLFLDEFGNTHIDLSKAGTFSHFVYTAIAFKHSDLSEFKNVRDRISKKFFHGSIIKSSNITNDENGFKKRIEVLKELKKSNFIVYTLIVDKSKLASEGLKYKKTFYKFFQRIFIEKFAHNYLSFQIFADKVGGSEFQRELFDYINKKAINRDLFHQDRQYNLADDKVEQPLVQLADFLCGCVGKIYCISHQYSQFEVLFELLSDRLFVEFFPNNFETYNTNTLSNIDEKEVLITQIAVQGIIDFINLPNPKYPECIEIAKYLLLVFKTNPTKLVSTKELISVCKNRFGYYNQDHLRQNIAYMRDNGLLIVSPQGKYGYKIPNTKTDIINFYHRYLSSIKPMLRRIKKSNNLIASKTINEVNILNETSDISVLSELIKTVEKLNIE